MCSGSNWWLLADLDESNGLLYRHLNSSILIAEGVHNSLHDLVVMQLVAPVTQHCSTFLMWPTMNSFKLLMGSFRMLH